MDWQAEWLHLENNSDHEHEQEHEQSELTEPLPDNLLFYETFLDILRDQEPVDQKLLNSDFRKFVVKKKGQTVETVKILAPGLLKTIQKPQQLIYTDSEYYIAIDTYTYTYYVCYRQLLMIDIDFYKQETGETQTKDDIIKLVQDYCDQHQDKQYHFRIYESRNGVHLFLISHFMNYQSDQALQLMLDLGCDFYYVIFCYLRGWCVRLNRKKDDREGDLYNLIGDVGSGRIIGDLENYTDLHMNLMSIFQSEKPNLMYGG